LRSAISGSSDACAALEAHFLRVRAIAIGVALLLLAAPGASGSRLRALPAVTQRALAAPLPPGADKKLLAGLSQVVCPSSSGCVATGVYNQAPGRNPGRLLALSLRGGKWTPETTPRHMLVTALACPSVGKCVGAAYPFGLRGEDTTFVVTESRRAWHPSVVGLPAGEGLPFPSLAAVACGSPGNCAAVGRYQTDKGPGGGAAVTHPLLVDERKGTWGAGIEAQLPPDAATTPDPNGWADIRGVASIVSCPSAGNCVAGGSYADTIQGTYRTEGWIATEQAGQWGQAVQVQLPPDASAVDGDPAKSGTAPFFGFTGLSCPSLGNCTAIGGYEDRRGNEQGLILTERKGGWLPGIRAPLPRGAIAPIEPNAWDNPLFSISCATANDCAATGAWVLPNGKGGYPGIYHGWLLTERQGKWRASKAVLPRKPRAGGDVFLKSTSCASPGNCVAVGWYRNGKYGLILVERRGKWRHGIRPALPPDAAGPKKVFADLNSVSCPSASRCTVVGQYPNRAGKPRGLILSLRLR
jgi:hypothetical protein